jgi:hypothetical protein
MEDKNKKIKKVKSKIIESKEEGITTSLPSSTNDLKDIGDTNTPTLNESLKESIVEPIVETIKEDSEYSKLLKNLSLVIDFRNQKLLDFAGFWNLYRKTFGGNRRNTTCSSCIASAAYRFVEKLKSLK